MNSPKPSNNTDVLNTLRQTLSVEDWQQALEAAKAQRVAARPKKDRREPTSRRHQVVHRCLLRVDRGDAAPGIYVVRSSDISSAGLSLIHGGAIDKDTVCCVIIESEQGQSIAAGGVVAWCKPIDKTTPPAYQMGIRFYEPIDADHFAESASASEEAA